jgi:hypothetical protein
VPTTFRIARYVVKLRIKVPFLHVFESIEYSLRLVPGANNVRWLKPAPRRWI